MTTHDNTVVCFSFFFFFSLLLRSEKINEQRVFGTQGRDKISKLTLIRVQQTLRERHGLSAVYTYSHIDNNTMYAGTARSSHI